MNLLKTARFDRCRDRAIPVALRQRTSAEVAVKGRANAYASLAANGAVRRRRWGASTNDGVTDIYAAVSAMEGALRDANTRQ